MELPRKIELYVQRPFGDKLNATFDFLKENWKPMFKYLTFLLLPFSLIQGYSSSKTSSIGMDTAFLTEFQTNPLAYTDVLLYYFVTLLVAFIGGALVTSLVYSMMQIYASRDERLNHFTFDLLKPFLFKNMGRAIVLVLSLIPVLIVLALIMGLLMAITPWTLLLSIPLLFAFVVAMAHFMPIYLFENISLSNAFMKTFRFGFATWGGTFAILLVLTIIVGVVQLVFSIPYYVAYMVKYFFTMSDVGVETTISGGYSFFLYVLSVLVSFGAFLASTFTLVGIAYQYGHASETIDSVSVTSDIENFDNL